MEPRDQQMTPGDRAVRIAIVDDERANTRVFRRYLVLSLGADRIETVEGSDGADAIALRFAALRPTS